MKTTKLFLSIIGLVVATISFGQLISLHEISKNSDLNMGCFLDHDSEVLFYTANYNEEQGRLEHWVYEVPVVSRTYFVNDAEISYDDGPEMEQWMTTPFDEYSIDEELRIESWMIAPFETDDLGEIEAWMTAAWI